jgi:hypothetical protein
MIYLKINLINSRKTIKPLTGMKYKPVMRFCSTKVDGIDSSQFRNDLTGYAETKINKKLEDTDFISKVG